MKKMMLALLATAAFAGITAQAEPIRTGNDPLWECALTFQAKGGGFQVLVGHFELAGPGKISCVNAEGTTEVLPVRVTMGASPLALNVAIGAFKVAGVATGIGVATGPKALLGKYALANAQAAFIIGAGGSVALHGGAEALTVNVGVNLLQGFGVQAGLNKLTITAADSDDDDSSDDAQLQ
jgi:hypothetical protein